MLILQPLNNKTHLKYYLCDCLSAVVCWPDESGGDRHKTLIDMFCISVWLIFCLFVVIAVEILGMFWDHFISL